RGGTAAAVGGAGESVQRMCADCEQEQEQVRRAPTEHDKDADEEKRKKKPPDEPPVQRKAEAGGITAAAGSTAGAGAADGNAVPGATAARIGSRRGGGAPLPSRERAFFE